MYFSVDLIIVCLISRFFMMHLIGKPETEFTGQVSVSKHCEMLLQKMLVTISSVRLNSKLA